MFPFAQGLEQMLQAVDFDLQAERHQHSQSPLWESLLLEPQQIGFWKIDQRPAAVFTKWHLHVCHFK